MAGYHQRSCRYPSLRITVKHETEERSVTEIYSNPRVYHHPKTVFYNSNHRQKQYFNRPSTTVQHRSSQKYHHIHHQQPPPPIRPLMEIQDFNDHDYSYSSYIFKQKEPAKQRGQYRNRKAELDWDHAFDLDQIDLYPVQNDIDIDSLISLNSSSDNSFSSV